MWRDLKLDQLPVKHRSNVFISGTYDDLADIREKVAEAIEEAGEGPIEPHYSGGSNEDIREKVGRQIRFDADLYVGVFGTRYGTRVSSEEGALSYSHFEYLKALEKWEMKTPPPMAVFTPHPVKGPEFYRQVKDKCDAALKATYGDDAALLAEDRRRQGEFIEFVQRTKGDPRLGNKIIQPVRSLEHLCRMVAVWIERYKGDTLFLWAHELVAGPPSRVEPEPSRWPLQLGQVERVCSLLAHASKRRTLIPGICLLIRGARAHGQTELSSLIAQPRFWDNEHDPFYLELEKPDPLNEQKVWEVLWTAADKYPPGAWDDADALAKYLLEADQPLVVVVRRIQLMDGWVKGFAERIWQPVYDSLLKVSRGRVPEAMNTRLIVVITYEGGDFELEEEIGCDAGASPDDMNFRKLLSLTKLP
jgi:hypothetical protein